MLSSRKHKSLDVCKKQNQQRLFKSLVSNTRKNWFKTAWLTTVQLILNGCKEPRLETSCNDAVWKLIIRYAFSFNKTRVRSVSLTFDWFWFHQDEIPNTFAHCMWPHILILSVCSDLCGLLTSFCLRTGIRTWTQCQRAPTKKQDGKFSLTGVIVIALKVTWGIFCIWESQYCFGNSCSRMCLRSRSASRYWQRESRQCSTSGKRPV